MIVLPLILYIHTHEYDCILSIVSIVFSHVVNKESPGNGVSQNFS